MGFIGDVWRGERSLAQTFWLWNVLVGAVIYGLIGGLGFGTVSATTGSLEPQLAFTILTVPYQVWIFVGLWQSATRNPGFWAVIVKIIVVLGLLAAAAQWFALLAYFDLA